MALTPRHQWRLLNLVKRVSAHEGALCQTPATAAPDALLRNRPALRHANAAAAESLPLPLDVAEARRLLRHLGGLRRSDATPRPWQALRNGAALALQLGAGLGPGELRALRLADVQVEPRAADWLAPEPPLRPDQTPAHWRPGALPWRVLVPAAGGCPSHAAPLARWAAQLLSDWLALRSRLGVPGDWLLPATRTGKPWGKVAQYQAAQQLLTDAGVPAQAAGGSFRLRHAFALRQLRRGHPPERVAHWLGVRDPAVMSRYQRLLAPASASQAISR